MSLRPSQEFVDECIDLLFRVSCMNDDPDSRSLHNRKGHGRNRVSPLQQVVRQPSRARCEDRNDRGAQAMIRDHNCGIGFAERKDGLRNAPQSNEELLACVTGQVI